MKALYDFFVELGSYQAFTAESLAFFKGFLIVAFPLSFIGGIVVTLLDIRRSNRDD